MEKELKISLQGADLNLEGDLSLRDLLYGNVGSAVKPGATRRIADPRTLIKAKDLMILHP